MLKKKPFLLVLISYVKDRFDFVENGIADLLQTKTYKELELILLHEGEHGQIIRLNLRLEKFISPCGSESLRAFESILEQ
jgi:hypothetical protein